MTYKRTWTQWFVYQRDIAAKCQEFTDGGWTVFSIVYNPSVGGGVLETRVGACIVAYKDEPDLTGGVSR